MNGNRLLGLLGICRKAGRLKLGFDPVAQSLGKDACLLIFSGDISPKTKGRMLKKAGGLDIKSLTLAETSDDIWRAVGKRVAVMAITEEGLAKRAAELYSPAHSLSTENYDEEDTDL